MDKFKYPQYLMVYGTLKKGYGNCRLLGSAYYVGECVTKQSSFSISASGLPMVYLADNGHRVKGELYIVSPDDMLAIDSLEGHPNWYCRQRVPLEDGTLAWLYIMKSSDGDDTHMKTVEPVDGIVEWTR